MRSSRRLFRVDRREINYIQLILGSYDGMVQMTTVDPYTALIELRVAPGCEDSAWALLEGLRGEGVEIFCAPEQQGRS